MISRFDFEDTQKRFYLNVLKLIYRIYLFALKMTIVLHPLHRKALSSCYSSRFLAARREMRGKLGQTSDLVGNCWLAGWLADSAASFPRYPAGGSSGSVVPRGPFNPLIASSASERFRYEPVSVNLRSYDRHLRLYAALYPEEYMWIFFSFLSSKKTPIFAIFYTAKHGEKAKAFKIISLVCFGCT